MQPYLHRKRSRFLHDPTGCIVCGWNITHAGDWSVSWRFQEYLSLSYNLQLDLDKISVMLMFYLYQKLNTSSIVLNSSLGSPFPVFSARILISSQHPLLISRLALSCFSFELHHFFLLSFRCQLLRRLARWSSLLRVSFWIWLPSRYRSNRDTKSSKIEYTLPIEILSWRFIFKTCKILEQSWTSVQSQIKEQQTEDSSGQV